MKKAISLMLVLLLALTALGAPVFADEAALEAAATEAPAEVPEQPEAAPRAEVKLVKDETLLYQKGGRAIPETGFPMTKGNVLTVRTTIQGGAKKDVAKGRVSIGTALDNPKSDVAKVTLDKVRLAGRTEFRFSLKALKGLESGKEYTVFFQSAKTKKHPAIARVAIAKVKVISAKAIEEGKAARRAAAAKEAEQQAAAEADEAAEAADEAADEAAGIATKDLRHKLTVSTVALTPANGAITSATNALQAAVTLAGGAKGDSVQASLAIADSAGKPVLETAYISANAQGTTTFTFTAAELSALENSKTYKLLISSKQTSFYAPLEAADTGKTVTTSALRAARPDLGAVALSQASWDLVADKDRDVVLTVEASPAVRATFAIAGKTPLGEELVIEAPPAVLAADKATTFTFPKAELLKLGTTGADGYSITVATDASDAYLAHPAAAAGAALAITGAARKAVSISAANFASKYTLGSGQTWSRTEIAVSEAVTGLPITVRIGDKFKYNTTLDLSEGKDKGKFTIPAARFNEAAAAKELEPTKADALYAITIESAGSDAFAPIAAVKLGTMEIPPLATTVVTISTAIVTNGDARTSTGGTNTSGFGRARGVNAPLTVKVKLTANASATAGADLSATLVVATPRQEGGAYYVNQVAAEIPLTTKLTSATQELTFVIPAATLGSLKEQAYIFGLNIAGTDAINAAKFTQAIGALTLDDSFSTTPAYNGTADASSTWTKGGKKKELKNFVSYTNGVVGRTMTANVYAVLAPITTKTTTVPAAAIKIATQTVNAEGGTKLYTLTAKGLEKLAADKTYYLYIQGEKSPYNTITYLEAMGKLAVKAGATSGGGGGSSTGSGGSGTDASTDGGTDSVSSRDAAASDTAPDDQISFGTYQALGMNTLEWMLARQPLMGREFLKYLLNQKGSQKVAIPLAHVADMANPIQIPIVGGGQWMLGMAIFEPTTEGDATGYLFSVEPESFADMANLKMHLGSDFEDLGRTLTDADYYAPGDFVPASTLKLAQLDGSVAYDPTKAEKVSIDPEVTNRITEWMAEG